MDPWQNDTPELRPPNMLHLSSHYWPIAQVIHGLHVKFRPSNEPAKWSLAAERLSGSHLISFPTADITFSSSQWITAIRDLMAMTADWHVALSMMEHGTIGVILAKALANSSDTLNPLVLKHCHGTHIRPLPTFLYSNARSILAHSGTPEFPFVTPPPGQWTILLLNDVDASERSGGDIATPHYCFLRSKATASSQGSDPDRPLDISEFELHDFESFLTYLPRDESCAQGQNPDDARREQIEFWNEHMFRDNQGVRDGGWRLCQEEVIRDILDCANLKSARAREEMRGRKEMWSNRGTSFEKRSCATTNDDDVD